LRCPLPVYLSGLPTSKDERTAQTLFLWALKMEYSEFLELKKVNPIISGHDVSLEMLNEDLFDFQRAIVKWAVKRGRAAIFADTGLGKTLMQTSWADEVVKETGGNVLILAPLCVAHQTVNEGAKFGIAINYCRDQSGVVHGINITNYEMLDRFDFDDFHGIVLDESSIIKNRDGKTRNAIIDACKNVPYRLSCTATPSPNDFMELGNQAELLGLMTMAEMLAMYFINDAGDTGTWILKGHGKAKFWGWLSTWSVVMRSPADLGFDGSRYLLPELKMHDHVVESKSTVGLFADIATGLLERNQARKESIDDRVAKCAEIVNASDQQWVIWCHRNEESEKLCKAIPGSADVQGSDSIDQKEQKIDAFTNGELRVLITKPKIFGHGMNWQHCNHTAFVGLSDSWEQYYQAIRRFYRFGQKKQVHVHVISAESEGAVVENIKRKEEQNKTMGEEMVKYMSESMKKEIFGLSEEKTEYIRQVHEGDGFTIHNADCIDLAREIESDSIGFTIYSPPFASLFTYSNSDRDMGNSKGHGEFYQHFGYLVDELYRITMPGRLMAVHCMNLPTSKVNDGFIGIRDFRGELIRLFVEKGWIYHSEVCIWKDPVTAMQRTKALGLLHKTIKKDSSMSRQGLADYLVIMRKPGDNTKPISHTPDEFPVDLWQQYASPVWFDINQSRTLNFREAREDDDVKHICPLQLDVIERAMNLWSAPDDLVFSPFTGVGSEGYTAIKMGRRFIGSELKPSYYDQAIKNIESAKIGTMDLFS
jgi:superfamily II DNA or RNA helicase